MIKIESNQVFSAEGKLVRRKGADTCFKRGIALPGDTAADYEEADEAPAYTKEEYDAKVAELVRERYSDSEEFAIQRKLLALMVSPDSIDTLAEEGAKEHADSILEEFAEYNAFVEECKSKAKALLSIKDEG